MSDQVKSTNTHWIQRKENHVPLTLVIQRLIGVTIFSDVRIPSRIPPGPTIQ